MSNDGRPREWPVHSGSRDRPGGPHSAPSPDGILTIRFDDGTLRAKLPLTNVTVNYPWRIARDPDNPSEDKLPANTSYTDN
jgi:hypothetical protein